MRLKDLKFVKQKTIGRHLLAISKSIPASAEQALDYWYLAKKKDYDAFAQKYLPSECRDKSSGRRNRWMNAWCDKAEITFTPTIYVNGHRLPEKYGVDELKFIL